MHQRELSEELTRSQCGNGLRSGLREIDRELPRVDDVHVLGRLPLRHDGLLRAAADLGHGLCGVGSLGEHTELLLRKVIGVHKEHWSCLATTAHAEKVDDFFSRRGGRKRGRS